MTKQRFIVERFRSDCCIIFRLFLTDRLDAFALARYCDIPRYLFDKNRPLKLPPSESTTTNFAYVYSL